MAQEGKDKEKFAKMPYPENEKITLRSDSKNKARGAASRQASSANIHMLGDCDDQELSDTHEMNSSTTKGGPKDVSMTQERTDSRSKKDEISSHTAKRANNVRSQKETASTHVQSKGRQTITQTMSSTDLIADQFDALKVIFMDEICASMQPGLVAKINTLQRKLKNTKKKLGRAKVTYVRLAASVATIPSCFEDSDGS